MRRALAVKRCRTLRLFQPTADPWIALTYNPYDVDGSGSSDAKSLSSRCPWAGNNAGILRSSTEEKKHEAVSA
jgi:hypothetical protein